MNALEEESLEPKDRDWRVGIATAIGVALLLAGVVFPIVWLSPLVSDRDSPSIAPAASSSAGVGEASPSGEDVSPPPGGPPFHPETYLEGEMTVMPVTFSDGSSAELVYPTDLELERGSVYPDVYIEGGPRSCGENTITSRSNMAGGVYEADRPIEIFSRTGGDDVGLWRSDSWDPYTFLVVPIDSWVVAVFCYPEEPYQAAGRSGPPRLPPFRHDEVALWAESIDGYETKDGFLVMTPRAPLMHGKWRQNAGPTLRISFETQEFRIIDIGLEECDPSLAWDRDGNGEVSQWCVSPGIRVYANGPESFLDALAEGLEIREFQRGSAS